MGFKQVMSASREMIMGAIFTGIALVIANSWGTFLTTSTAKVVNSIRCSKYKKKDVKKDNNTPLPSSPLPSETNVAKQLCESEITVWGTFWGAIITSIFLTFVIIIMMWIRGKKHQTSRRVTGSSEAWQGAFDKAVYA